MRSGSFWMTTMGVGFLSMAVCGVQLQALAQGAGGASGNSGTGATGQGGTNGLKPDTYYPNATYINDLMVHPLKLPSARTKGWLATLPLPKPSSGGYEPTEQERQNRLLLADIVGCALSTGHGWDAGSAATGKYNPSYTPFSGEGLLKGTDTWLTSPLAPPTAVIAPQQAVDVHTCLIARLNAYGRILPIWLTGPNVAATTRSGVYTYREAVWLAVPNFQEGEQLKVVLYAMPLDGLKSNCSNPDSAIQWRICGQVLPDGSRGPNLCNVNVLPNATTPPCQEKAPGQWYCTVNNRKYAAIETRLNPQDWHLIYGCGKQCAPP